jgi:hypothetical protein
MVEWLAEFTPFVRSVQDLQDLVTHLGAVTRQHALFAEMPFEAEADASAWV